MRQADIRRVWDSIRPGLEKLKARFSLPWRPEDIYADCLYGEAFLFVDEEGFVVLRREESIRTGEKVLFIWVAFGEGDVQEKYYPEIEQIAREWGCTAVEFRSPRPGFAKNWEVKTVTYRREIHE